MLQYEIARFSLPPVPAALTMAGPNPNFGTPNSNNMGISGIDGCTTAGHQQVNLPGIGTTTDVAANGDASASDTATNAAAAISAAIFRPQMVTGLGCNTQQAQAAGGDVQNVINIAPNYNTPGGLQSVVESVMGVADQIATSDSGVTNWGTDANPQVIAITGNAHLQNGAGILLVTGNATASGSFSWDGIVLIIGNGSLVVNGGGNGAVNGSIVVANIAGNSDYARNPSNANLAATLGSPTFDWHGGGTNFLQYNSCWTTAASQHATFKVLARREIVY